MDAKSRANFLNSVASGAAVACPQCGATNKPESSFCETCGAKLSAPAASENSAPAFASVNPQPARQAAPQPAAPKPEQPAPVKKYVEPSAAFAEGLPEWSIEPPQVVVRRR